MPSHERSIEEFQYSLHREINELYWAAAIRNFAISLLGIFMPIYLYQLFNNSFAKVLLFYAAQYLLQVLFVPLAARLLEKWGIKKLMAVGSPFLGLHFLMLMLAPVHGLWLLIPALVFVGAYLVLFWPARHIEFARFASKLKRGRQVGMTNIILTIIKAVAPLTGGVIIVAFGFNTLFVISIVLLFVAMMPLFFSPEVYETYTLSWKESFKAILKKNNIRTNTAFFFEGIEYLISIVFFSIFIFITIGKIETIGWVTSASLLLVLFFSYIVGYLSDKKGSRKVVSYASVTHAFSWLFLPFIGSTMQYLALSSFWKIAESANHQSFNTLYYQRAQERRHGIDEYIVQHEIAHNIGKCSVALIGAVAFAWFGSPFVAFFVTAAVASLLYRILR